MYKKKIAFFKAGYEALGHRFAQNYIYKTDVCRCFFPLWPPPPGAGRFSLRTERFPFGSDTFPSEPGASLPDPGTSPFPPHADALIQPDTSFFAVSAACFAPECEKIANFVGNAGKIKRKEL